MNVVIGSDEHGKNLKSRIKQYLLKNNYKL